jgi:hypothetical protein
MGSLFEHSRQNAYRRIPVMFRLMEIEKYLYTGIEAGFAGHVSDRKRAARARI